MLVERDSHFIHIPYYIHLNPLDFSFPQWRQGNLHNIEAAVKFLDSYRWSSWRDYVEQKNFPSILYTQILSELLKDKEAQLGQIKQIVTDLETVKGASTLEI